MRHWEAVKAGPKPLTHKQLVALAGDAYHERVAKWENNLDFGPDVLQARLEADEDAYLQWRYGDGDELGEIAAEHARFYAAIQRPMARNGSPLRRRRTLSSTW